MNINLVAHKHFKKQNITSVTPAYFHTMNFTSIIHENITNRYHQHIV